MLSLEKAVSIADQIVNPSDAQALKNMIYELQKENIDFKLKYEECLSQLKVFQEWETTKAQYKEYKTSGGSIVHVLAKESSPEIFYCPVCFSEKSIISLQAISHHIRKILQMSGVDMYTHKYCPECNVPYFISKKKNADE